MKVKKSWRRVKSMYCRRLNARARLKHWTCCSPATVNGSLYGDQSCWPYLPGGASIGRLGPFFGFGRSARTRSLTIV